jgi:hypothetical protein
MAKPHEHCRFIGTDMGSDLCQILWSFTGGGTSCDSCCRAIRQNQRYTAGNSVNASTCSLGRHHVQQGHCAAAIDLPPSSKEAITTGGVVGGTLGTYPAGNITVRFTVEEDATCKARPLLPPYKVAKWGNGVVGFDAPLVSAILCS